MRNKYMNYIKVCEIINITPLSFSNWIENKEIDEAVYQHLISNINKVHEVWDNEYSGGGRFIGLTNDLNKWYDSFVESWLIQHKGADEKELREEIPISNFQLRKPDLQYYKFFDDDEL